MKRQRRTPQQVNTPDFDAPNFDAPNFDTGALSVWGTDPLSVRQRVEAMERLLERSITIPGTRKQIGLDAVGGIIPVFGDFITAALGAWLVWEARNLGMPRWKLVGMSSRIGFDMLLGAIPLVGDVADIFYRSNRANLKMILRHLDRHHPETRVIEG